jgi:hypothetical protein
MLPVLVLVLKQMAVVIGVIAVLLCVVRMWGLGVYQDTGIVLLIFLMAALVAVAAVWGVFVQPWWVYALAWAVLGGLALLPIFGLVELFGRGTLEKLGPAGTAFLFPMIAFFLLFPLSGVLQFVIGLIRR